MLEKYMEEQNLVTTVLQKSLKNDKLVQAYLFSSDDIDYIYKYAKDFSKDIISLSGLPSETLENIYKRIDKDEYTELKVVEPDGNTIKKSQLIELQNSVSTKPVEANKIIYIIKNCEKLNSSSANCMLKFLEEPEDDIIAILLTDNINMVLPTIKSRCQILNFKNNNSNKMTNILFFVGLDITDEDKEKFIHNSIDFLMNIEKYKINTMIKVKKLAYDVYKTSDDFLILCNILLYMYDDCIHYKVKNEINYMNDYKEVIDEICSLNNIESLGKKIKIVENVKNELGLNANMKLLFDKLIIELSEV